MTTIIFDPAAFRAQFSAFSNTVLYPDAAIQPWFDLATAYITANYAQCYSGFMTLAQQTQALNLMTAHLLALNQAIAAGDTTGVVTGATIDKVSVQLQPPPETNQWQWWLNQTPYGSMLLALLQIAGVGGRYYTGYRGPIPFRRL